MAGIWLAIPVAEALGVIMSLYFTSVIENAMTIKNMMVANLVNITS